MIVAFAQALLATARLREREQQAAELAAHLTQAQLAGLRTQLQPHFLFNTLNSISALIPNDAKLANEMVLNLSDLLRMTLRDPQRGEISLREELTLLGHYVNIQKLRFGERLVFNLVADDSTMNFPVPPMLLQPLVENAIRYGVELSEQPEQITVRAKLAEQNLELEVTNTFHGSAEESSAPKNSTGVGLANTRARLAALYGAAQSFAFGALPDGGFRVQIKIPQRSSASTNHEN
jgi:sensor histidine kinase YesM